MYTPLLREACASLPTSLALQPCKKSAGDGGTRARYPGKYGYHLYKSYEKRLFGPESVYRHVSGGQTVRKEKDASVKYQQQTHRPAYRRKACNVVFKQRSRQKRYSGYGKHQKQPFACFKRAFSYAARHQFGCKREKSFYQQEYVGAVHYEYCRKRAKMQHNGKRHRLLAFKSEEILSYCKMPRA